MYTPINIESSYRENNLGETLYNTVLEKKPTTIIEFGCLYGYSTIAMGLALKDLGRGKIISYDIWDKYAYKHTTLNTAADNISRYGLTDFVEFRDCNFWEWLESGGEDFDLLHLDISNTGDIILSAYTALQSRLNNGATLLFEGGSLERDQEQWMLQYNKTPINSIKQQVHYSVLNENWPSISRIQND